MNSAASPAEVPVIAIDGPSASGKGTVASEVARALGFHYLDSGALYRLATLAALRGKVDLDDEEALARSTARMRVEFRPGSVWLDGEDVTEALRTEAVSAAASRVAARPAVRRALLDRQRGFRRPPGLVADGRDMGTVIFPDAGHKVFLTASAAERAKMRYKQLKDKGLSVTLAVLQREIEARDERDASRLVAPLKPAEGAVVIDTTGMPIDTVVANVFAVVRP